MSRRAPTRRSGSAADHGQHGGTELVGEPSVQGELVGQLGVGEVRAEHENDFIVPRDPVEPVDELRDQFVGALLRLERGRLVVVHAVHGRGVLREPVPGAQQVEEPVGAVVDQWPEDAHPVDLPGEELHDSQFDDLAAVAPVDAGHVHAARHACSLLLRDR